MEARDPPCTSWLKLLAWGGGCSAQAKIGIDHVDVGLMPAEFSGRADAASILQPQALLVAHHLMGCRLADVDPRPCAPDGLASPVRTSRRDLRQNCGDVVHDLTPKSWWQCRPKILWIYAHRARRHSKPPI